jgi:hypothetical protein
MDGSGAAAPPHLIVTPPARASRRSERGLLAHLRVAPADLIGAALDRADAAQDRACLFNGLAQTVAARVQPRRVELALAPHRGERSESSLTAGARSRAWHEIVPLPVVIDADVLSRSVDHALQMGYQPAVVRRANASYTNSTGITLLATERVVDETFRRFSAIAKARG